MSLIDTMKTGCVFLEKRIVPDGLGGYITTWFDGAEFDAAIIKDSSIQARIAEKEGVTAVYTVTVDKTLQLEFHDVFRRKSDGQVFRVTNNITDSQTPRIATFQFGQVTAEEWVLPS